MPRKYISLLLLLLATSMDSTFACDPNAYVWNKDAEALRRVTSLLRTVLTIHFLLLFGAGVIGLRLLALPSTKQRVVMLLLLLFGWGLTERWVQQALGPEYYTIWKHQLTDEETSQQMRPSVTPQLLPFFLRDVQNPTEALRIRSKVALALEETQTQEAYPVLKAIVQDPHENPYLQFHCLKALRLLQPQQFSALLAASPADSAVALYQRYGPSKM